MTTEHKPEITCGVSTQGWRLKNFSQVVCSPSPRNMSPNRSKSSSGYPREHCEGFRETYGAEVCASGLQAKCVSKKPSPLPLLPPTNVRGHFTQVPLPQFPHVTCVTRADSSHFGGRRVRPRASHASGPGANKNRFFLASSLRPEGMPPPSLQGRNLKASVVVGGKVCRYA